MPSITPSRIQLFADSARPLEHGFDPLESPHCMDTPDSNPISEAGAIDLIELAVLRSVLEGQHVPGLDHLQVVHFDSTLLKRAWNAIVEIKSGRHRDIHSVDRQTVGFVAGFTASELKVLEGGNPTSSNSDLLSSYVAILKENAARRGFKAAAQEIQALTNTTCSIADKLSQAQASLQRVTSHVPSKAVSIGQACIQVIDSAVALVENKESHFRPVLTGLHDLDALTGGLHPGDVIVLAARPSVGKTTCALTIGLNAAKSGRQVKVVSLEMTQDRLGRRILASEAEVDSHLIKAGALTESQWVAVADATLRLSDVPLVIDDCPEADCESLIASAEADAEAGKLDLLIIDYLQLMDLTSHKNENRVALVGAMSRKLKKLAQRIKRPILVLSQLSRNVTQRRDPRPQMSDLRESGAIEQDADVILMLYEDAKDKDNSNPEIEILVEKNRDGPKGAVLVRHAKPFNKFMNLENSDV